MKHGIFIVNRYRMSATTATNAQFLSAHNSAFQHACQQALDNCGKPHVFRQNGIWIQLRITQ